MGRDHEGGGLTEVESRCLTALIEFLDTTRLRRSRGPRCGGAPGGHPCSRRLPLIDDGVVRCANQGCTLCLADADPVVTGWPLS